MSLEDKIKHLEKLLHEIGNKIQTISYNFDVLSARVAAIGLLLNLGEEEREH